MYLEFERFNRRKSKHKQIKELKRRLDTVEEILNNLLKHLEVSVANNYPFSKWGEWEILKGRNKDDA